MSHHILGPDLVHVHCHLCGADDYVERLAKLEHERGCPARQRDKNWSKNSALLQTENRSSAADFAREIPLY